MRKLLILAALALAGCTTWATWFDGTKYDQVSDTAAERELFQLGENGPAPGTAVFLDGKVESVTGDAVSVRPLEPGSAAYAFRIDDETRVEFEGAQVAHDQLAPGDVVRVSFAQESATLTPATRVEVIHPAPE